MHQHCEVDIARCTWPSRRHLDKRLQNEMQRDCGRCPLRSTFLYHSQSVAQTAGYDRAAVPGRRGSKKMWRHG